jgi:hypothetical protein
MSRRVGSPLTALLLVLAAHCGGRVVQPEAAGYSGRERSLRVIGRAEIEATPARNAEDLLRRVRPHLLLPRPVRGRGLLVHATPVVYVNDVRQGGLEILHHLPVHSILEIAFLPAVDADRTLIGLHPAGAIVVRTRPASR